MIMNLFIGVLVSAVIIILGGTDDEGESEACRNRPGSSSAGTERNSVEKRNRSGSTLTVKEKTERLRLKTARLTYLTEKLKQGDTKNEPILENKPDPVGSVIIDNPGTQSNGSDGKTTVNDTAKKED